MTIKRFAIWLLNLSALVVFATLLIWGLDSSKTMLMLFSNVSYYLIFLILALWVIQATVFLRQLNFSLKLLLRNYWPGIVLALALTILVFVSVKVGFKTLSDETNMLSVSGSMARTKTVLNCTMAKFYYGNIQPINQEVEKRPLVFPFLVNILHTFTGFRYQNVFILNFIIMFLFLSGVYIATKKLLDASSAFAAMFLILSYPVFSIFATSAGFDVLNSAFFVLILAISYYFIKSPSSSAFALLLCSLIIFANIRYESIIFLPIVLLLLVRKIKWQYIKDASFVFCVIPLVNLPYLWVRLLKPKGYFESVKDVQLFSFGALAKNLAEFFNNLLDFSSYMPYAGIISLAGIIIFVYLIIQILRGKVFVESHQRYFLVVILISAGLSTLMYFSHFFGHYAHPSSARFFITLSILFALCPIALRIANPRLISGPALLFLAVISFIYYHPVAVEGRFINTLTLNRLTNHCVDFLNKLDDKNILVVSSRPGQYVALGCGAVDFSYANNNKNSLLNETRRHLYSKVIIFQEILYKTGKPDQDTTLDDAFNLSPLQEIQTTAEAFLRISEVSLANEHK